MHFTLVTCSSSHESTFYGIAHSVSITVANPAGDSDMGLVYKDWAIALGATTAVFLVTTLVLASILFAILCRKIARLRKERNSRETRVLQGRYW